MTEQILDIGTWKTKYPFLKDVSKIYDELDKNIDDDTNSNWYNILCGKIIQKYGGEISKHKETCMKLVRNLGFYSMDSIYFKYNYDRCNILYNWIYNSIEKGRITDDIIKYCYDDYVQAKKSIRANKTCIYHSYNDYYKEPENIMLLNVFESYFEIIKDTMNGEIDSYISSGHKCICELVNIYNNMNSKYCHGKGPNDQKQQNICVYLSTFKKKYNFFLFDKLNKKDNIPSLDDDNSVYMNKCKSDEQTPALPTEVHDEGPRFPHSRRGSRESLDIFSSQPTDSIYDPKTSISSTVSTTVGTVAGTSSILALLYKFTPGRNWIRSGIRGSKGRINSNFYSEEPSQLLFNGMEHNDFNSYNIGYEAI